MDDAYLLAARSESVTGDHFAMNWAGVMTPAEPVASMPLIIVH